MSKEDRADKGDRTSARYRQVDVAPSRHATRVVRLEALDRFISEQLVPMRLSTDDAGTFQAKARSASLGHVELTDLWVRDPCVARRTRTLITADGPEYLKVGLQLSGISAVSQGSREATLRPGDLLLYDTSRPYQISSGPSSHMQTVMFSRGALRLSPAQLEQLPLRPINCRQGVGLLVSQYLNGVRRQLDAGMPSDSCYLANATLDLLAALFVAELPGTAPTDPDSGKAGLLLRVRADIENRLSDPYLDVPSIAAAHYISVRTLQKLFEDEEQTVTGWIRARRLERCRRDLALPALAQTPIGLIAANWGLIHQSHFSRLFKSAYGVCPRDYRNRNMGTPGA